MSRSDYGFLDFQSSVCCTRQDNIISRESLEKDSNNSCLSQKEMLSEKCVAELISDLEVLEEQHIELFLKEKNKGLGVKMVSNTVVKNS